MSDDLYDKLTDSAVWFRLKEMLSHAIMSLPESEEKQRYLSFMNHEWPGHAPRSREIATLVSRTTLLQREKDKLVLLLTVPVKK
jgi:hypothetical protein